MPLHDVLTALRELILDHSPLTGGIEERRLALKQRFGHLQLTYEEISDLAAIDPSRMQVYTELVFSGEREMLRWVFPMSLAAIHRLEGIAASGSNEFDYELTRELHRFRPWQRPSVRLLAMNFQAFIGERRREWLAGGDVLRELIDFERTDLEVHYAWDPEHRPMPRAEIEALASLSVEELLQITVVMPRFVALRRYSRDLPAWARRWHEERTLPEELEESEETFLACGRHAETLHNHWQRLDASEYQLLLGVPRDAPFSVNDLATAYLEGMPEPRDEAALFAAFFGRLVQWLEGGLLLRPLSN